MGHVTQQSLQWDQQQLETAERILASSTNPKLIRFKEFAFPQVDPVQFRVKSHEEGGEDLYMRNYCYPAYHSAGEADQEQPKKGVVFFVHGFSDYMGRFAHIGKKVSNQGYDFYGMDHRGHGSSGGHIAYLPSIDLISEDQFSYQKKVMAERYPDTNLPVFVMAHSLGCMITMNVLTRLYLNQGDDRLSYAGICLYNPFWGFASPVVNTLLPTMKIMYRVNRMAYSLDAAKFRKAYPEHQTPWVFDKENPIQKKRFPVHTFLEFEKEIKRIRALVKLGEGQGQSKSVACYPRPDQSKEFTNALAAHGVPILMQLGAKDPVIHNGKAKQVFNQLEPSKRELVEHPELEHGPFSDGEIIDHVIDLATDFFEKQTHK